MLSKIIILIICLGTLVISSSADTDSYTINYIIPAPVPNITAYYNSINGWNQTAMSLNAGNSAIFNVTIDQTITNVSWKVAGSEEQNTSSLEFTRAFNTVGDFNITAQAFNVNGSSNIIHTVVTVTTTGGGGTDWDWAYGYVKWDNGTAVNSATVATSAGNAYTDAYGYYSFGYIFEHGLTYNFNITKSGIWDNKSVTFTSGDSEIVNGTLATPPAAALPNITSWGNDNTSNSDIAITLLKNTNVTFNITANQSVTTTWTGTASPTKINGTDSTDSYAFKNFTSVGTFTVIASCSNANGSCLNSITWTVTVTGLGGIVVDGYVFNALEVPLQNARTDLDSNYDITDANGYYKFTNISEGTYTILARAIGYANSTTSITITGNTSMNFTLSEPVAIDNTDDIQAILGIAAMAVALIIVTGKRKKKKV